MVQRSKADRTPPADKEAERLRAEQRRAETILARPGRPKLSRPHTDNPVPPEGAKATATTETERPKLTKPLKGGRGRPGERGQDVAPAPASAERSGVQGYRETEKDWMSPTDALALSQRALESPDLEGLRRKVGCTPEVVRRLQHVVDVVRTGGGDLYYNPESLNVRNYNRDPITELTLPARRVFTRFSRRWENEESALRKLVALDDHIMTGLNFFVRERARTHDIGQSPGLVAHSQTIANWGKDPNNIYWAYLGPR